MLETLFSSAHRRRLVLKQGKERFAANHHPWLFAGAIGRESGPADAALADLVAADGTPIASGFHSPHSQIRLRALTFGEQQLTPELLRERIVAAIARRRAILNDETNCARIIHAEGDELSSIVVDKYDDLLVVEMANAGAEQLQPLIVETLRRELSPRGIFFKNDLPARKIEKLSIEPRYEGEGEGDAVAIVREHGLRFQVDPREGQKTGFFLDQRENRAAARRLASGRRMLNLFGYTGAFGVYAAAGGASAVENVDVSARAIEMARTNFELNGFTAGAQFTVADCFQFVRERAVAKQRWDFVVCDPPAFAKSRHDVERAARGYKDINLYALRLVEKGGLLMTYSCSGHMSLDLFQKVIFSAALDAGRRVAIIDRLNASSDHPVSIYCPEGEYLKGFLLEVLE